MDREELLAIYKDRENLPRLGAGSFNIVYAVGTSLVLKASKGDPDDTTWDYMEWCHLRLLKYGARSPEMVGFPLVLAVVNEGGLRACVMTRMQDSWAKFEMNGTKMVRRYAAYALATLMKTFNVDFYAMDLHSGNLMWDDVRKCLVIQDPFCSDHGTGPASNLPMPECKIKKPKAQWLRQPIHNVYQGARC